MAANSLRMATTSTSKSDKYLHWLPWLFTLSFVLITFLPRSVDDTMFMDGVTYAAISRNMSEGIGSFWRPFFANSFWLPYDNAGFFSGHPPLQFGLQALLFRVVGDTPAVENGYNLLILIGYILLIVQLWRKFLGPENEYLSLGWLPVLCWYGMVTVWYSIPNNFLDSTMGLFCLVSCYCQLAFLKEEKFSVRSYLWPFWGGIAVGLAFLTKGPVGLYPLAFSMIYAIFYPSRDLKKAWKASGIMVITLTAGGAAVLVSSPAREFMATYFNGQVLLALLQKRERTGTGWAAHFTLVIELMRNLYPHFFALAAVYALAFGLKLKITYDNVISKNSRIIAVVAFSGIAPMLVSVKQYPHYLLPALPFVALLIALLLVQRVHSLMFLKKEAAIALLCLGTLGSWGATAKKLTVIQPDVMVSNAKKLGALVPEASTIGICHDLYQHADIHANFQRYHHLSLTTQVDSARYVFADSACLPQFDLRRDSLVPLAGKYFLVIRKTGRAK